MKFLLVFLLITFALQQTALADATLSLTTDQEPVKILVKQGRIKIMAAGANNSANGEAIYDVAKRTLTIVDHENKSVFPVDQQTIERIGGTLDAAVSAVQGGLKSLPDEQRSRMEAMIRGFGLAIPEPQAPELTMEKGASKKHFGMACVEHLLYEDARALAQLCISQNNSLGLLEDDYLSLLAAQAFMLTAASQATQLAEQYGQKIPNFGNLSLDGVLLSSIQYGDYDPQIQQPASATFSVEKVAIDPIDAIELPAGYRIKSLP